MNVVFIIVGSVERVCVTIVRKIEKKYLSAAGIILLEYVKIAHNQQGM